MFFSKFKRWSCKAKFVVKSEAVDGEEVERPKKDEI